MRAAVQIRERHRPQGEVLSLSRGIKTTTHPTPPSNASFSSEVIHYCDERHGVTYFNVSPWALTPEHIIYVHLNSSLSLALQFLYRRGVYVYSATRGHSKLIAKSISINKCVCCVCVRMCGVCMILITFLSNLN